MGSNFRRYVMVMSVLVMLCVAVPVQVALACGGPESHISMEYNLETTDHIVKGQIVRRDDVGMSFILQVETYLTGGAGVRYLLVNRTNPRLFGIHQHGYDTQCIINGASLSDGLTGYFALKRMANGSYEFTARGYTNEPQVYELPIEEVFVRRDANAEESEDNLRRVAIDSEQEFLDLVAEMSGETAREALSSTTEAFRNPLYAPILITTEHGTRYMFPIDYRLLVPTEDEPQAESWSPTAYPALLMTPPFCAEVGCTLDAPDLSLYGTQIDENTIHFDYGYLDEPISVEGQAFAFAPNSEALLIWNGSTLVANLITRQRSIDRAGTGLIPSLYWDLEVPLATSESVSMRDLHGLAVWSADGTTFAYADADGVWVVDLFRQSTPQLIVSAAENGFASPLYLSMSGRFVAYTVNREGQAWTVVDRLSGEMFSNAIISPDERYMAHLWMTPREPRPDVSGCGEPIMQNCQLEFWDTLRYFTWTGDNTYLYIDCPDANSDEGCYFGHNRVHFGETLYRSFGADIWTADVLHEPRLDDFAYVLAPRMLWVNGYEIDLSSQLDGAIVDIAWLPSLFYDVPE